MPIYSQDLRDRVIDHLETGEHSQAETADLFGVALSTLEKWWRQWRETQQCVARPRRKPQRALAACEAVIRARVAAEPDVTLEALRAHGQAETGVVASPSMMCRTLQGLQLPRKKSVHDRQRDTPRVQALREAFTTTQRPAWSEQRHCLKFLDETGVHLGMTPGYGRAAPGTRVGEATPGHSGTHYTVTAVLSTAGLEAPWVLEGAMTSVTFETYVEQYLCPTLRPGNIRL